MFQRYAKQKLECSVQSCAEDQNLKNVRCPLLVTFHTQIFGVYQEIDSYSIFSRGIYCKSQSSDPNSKSPFFGMPPQRFVNFVVVVLVVTGT